ncbi:hypothetical protein NpNSSI1_00004998 [Neofusicoccum parvum]|nr:hypothetical protein NpNSSI1_00004998 [Neofusicoccum parvum]
MSVPDVDAAFENTESFHFLKHLYNIAKLLPSYEEARPRLEESHRARSEAGISTEQKARWMPTDAKKVLEQLHRAAAENNRGGDDQDDQDDQDEPQHGNYKQAVSHDGDNLADDSASSIEYPRRWADDEGCPSPDFSELD